MRSWDEERGRARLEPKMKPADGLTLESAEGMEAWDTAIESSSESIWSSVRFDGKESAILEVFPLIHELAEYNWVENDQIKMINFYFVRQHTPKDYLAAPALYLSGCTTVATNRGRCCVNLGCVGCVVQRLYNGCVV